MITPSFDNVLIIGNGFDIDLGLPTRYEDFLGSKQFNELLGLNNSIASHLKKKFELQRWVDVECELAYISKSGTASDNFSVEFRAVRNALFYYIKQIDCTNLNLDSAAASVVKSLTRALPKRTLQVVNFNYTNSVDELLKKLNAPYKVNVSHVHGHTGGADNKIVFGVQDGAQIKNEHAFLLKSASPVFEANWTVSKAMQSAKHSIVVFGHSLGVTDHSQFRPFFGLSNRKKSKLRVYYHDQTANDDLLSQIYILTSRELGKFRQLHDFKMCGPCDDEL